MRPRATLRLARLATFRFVAELLLVEEQLLPGSKHKFAAAVNTLQDLVGKLHSHVPRGRLWSIYGKSGKKRFRVSDADHAVISARLEEQSFTKL